MNINSATRSLIRKYEGCRLKAYLCPAGKWTIGWGSTFYQDGSSVKQGDVITQERADQLFIILLDQFSEEIKPLVRKDLNDNQFGALLSFAYNAGTTRFRSSTIRKMSIANPNNPQIRLEFMKWVNRGTPFEKGLTIRRKAESDLYFTPIIGNNPTNQ